MEDKAFAHLSLSVPVEGASNEWCEPVMEEIYYLAVHLRGKLPSDSYGKYGPNIVISSEIDELVLHMLKIMG